MGGLTNHPSPDFENTRGGAPIKKIIRSYSESARRICNEIPQKTDEDYNDTYDGFDRDCDLLTEAQIAKIVMPNLARSHFEGCLNPEQQIEFQEILKAGVRTLEIMPSQNREKLLPEVAKGIIHELRNWLTKQMKFPCNQCVTMTCDKRDEMAA